jgi:hypothetical protein
MLSLSELAAQTGKTMELRFANGHAVRAKLISVDLDDPKEIIYDIKEVLSTGPRDLESLKPGMVAAADPTTLVYFQALG